MNRSDRAENNNSTNLLDFPKRSKSNQVKWNCRNDIIVLKPWLLPQASYPTNKRMVYRYHRIQRDQEKQSLNTLIVSYEQIQQTTSNSLLNSYRTFARKSDNSNLTASLSLPFHTCNWVVAFSLNHKSTQQSQTRKAECTTIELLCIPRKRFTVQTILQF